MADETCRTDVLVEFPFDGAWRSDDPVPEVYVCAVRTGRTLRVRCYMFRISCAPLYQSRIQTYIQAWWWGDSEWERYVVVESYAAEIEVRKRLKNLLDLR